MKRSTIIWLVILAFIFILIIGLGILVYLTGKPRTGRDCLKTTDWLWNKNCLYFQEKFPDPSLKSPKDIKPYLVDFQFGEGGGPPIYLPMWYRIRYVNVNTGGYSDFSEWTTTPVIAGSCCLPCIEGPGQCKTQGYETCVFNQPTIGISFKDSEYSPMDPTKKGDYVYINLHRYVGTSANDNTPPPKNAKDEIVGYLKPGESYGGEQYYTWTDIMFNPCEKQGCSFPSWCQKEAKCKTC